MQRQIWRLNGSVLNADRLGSVEKGISDAGAIGEIWSILSHVGCDFYALQYFSGY